MRLSDRIGSQLDVARAEAQVGSVRAQLNDIVAQRAVAQHAIADLIGAAINQPVFEGGLLHAELG